MNSRLDAQAASKNALGTDEEEEVDTPTAFLTDKLVVPEHLVG
jgi:hypothetical protein